MSKTEGEGAGESGPDGIVESGYAAGRGRELAPPPPHPPVPEPSLKSGVQNAGGWGREGAGSTPLAELFFKETKLRSPEPSSLHQTTCLPPPEQAPDSRLLRALPTPPQKLESCPSRSSLLSGFSDPLEVVPVTWIESVKLRGPAVPGTGSFWPDPKSAPSSHPMPPRALLCTFASINRRAQTIECYNEPLGVLSPFSLMAKLGAREGTTCSPKACLEANFWPGWAWKLVPLVT